MLTRILYAIALTIWAMLKLILAIRVAFVRSHFARAYV